MRRMPFVLLVTTLLLVAGTLLTGALASTTPPSKAHPAMVAAPSAAPASPAKAAGKAAADDPVEDVDDVEVVPPAAADPAQAAIEAERGGWQDVAGRFHNAVVHVPIGWVLMVLLLDALAFAFRRKDLETSGLWALGGALLAFAPACATGLLREDFVGQTPEVKALIETHQALIFATIGVVAAAFLWRLGFRRNLTGARKGVYLSLVAGASVLVAIAGHWGGKVAWGPDYLPF
jgi:uncharacterized membrane protein